jgi:hypothetical protein
MGGVMTETRTGQDRRTNTCFFHDGVNESNGCRFTELEKKVDHILEREEETAIQLAKIKTYSTVKVAVFTVALSGISGIMGTFYADLKDTKALLYEGMKVRISIQGEVKSMQSDISEIKAWQLKREEVRGK